MKSLVLYGFCFGEGREREGDGLVYGERGGSDFPESKSNLGFIHSI